MRGPLARPDAVRPVSVTRQHVLDLLREQPILSDDDTAHPSGGLTAAQVATQLGIHVTTARFHLDLLTQHGVVQASFHRAGVGRPRKQYMVARAGSAASVADRHHRMLSELLVNALHPDTTFAPEAAGREWARTHLRVSPQPEGAVTAGEFLGKVGRLLDVLSEWGYGPEMTMSAGGSVTSIALNSCPFQKLAQVNPDVVCGVHRGLIAGSLECLGESEVTVDLQPFARNTQCLAEIRTKTPFLEETHS